MNLEFARLRAGAVLVNSLVITFCLAAIIEAQAAPEARHQRVVSPALIVRVTRGTNGQQVAHDHGSKVLAHIEGTGLYRFSLPTGANAATLARRLSRDARIVYAEPDRLSFIEGFRHAGTQQIGTQQFHIAFDDGFNVSGYANQMAYAQIDFMPGQTGGSGPGIGRGTIVAQFDTGATFNHPALKGHYLRGINLINPGSLPTDIPDGTTNSAVGHGTMVAGIIAKVDPSARIMPIRVLNGDGVGSVFDVARGIYYAISHGAQVINLSLSTSASSRTLLDAVIIAELEGVAVVAAAGNDGMNGCNYPSSYPGVMGVAALEANNTLAPFSDYGACVMADAPGDGITSTYYTGGYATWSGTSFAAPFLTGEVSLLLENDNLGLFPLEWIVWFSSNSIDSLNPGYAGLLGAGVIDVAGALDF